MTDETVVEMVNPTRRIPTQSDLSSAAEHLRHVANRIERGEAGSYVLAYEDLTAETVNLSFDNMPGTSIVLLAGMAHTLLTYVNARVLVHTEGASG